MIHLLRDFGLARTFQALVIILAEDLAAWLERQAKRLREHL